MDLSTITVGILSVAGVIGSIVTLVHTVRELRKIKSETGTRVVILELTTKTGGKRKILLSPDEERSVVELLDAVKEARGEQ